MQLPLTQAVSARAALWRIGAFAFALASMAPAFAQSFQTIAPFAILIDVETQSVLFEKSADDLMAPASTAKMMTAELIFRELKEGRLKLADEFTISEHAWRDGGSRSGGSSMFAVLNSRVSIGDLLHGLIIQSGNDSAIALAEGIAGSEDAFATLMTRRAHELGMNKSTFANPWGKSDPAQMVTARDMARLADHIIKAYPDYYKIFGEREFTWNKIKQQNRNPLLTMELGADGLKTGDIKDSGFGLVGSAVQNGQRLIVVLNGLKTAKDRAEEARKLLQWGFRTFEPRTIFKEGEVIGSAKLYGGAQSEAPLVADGPIKVLLQRGGGERLSGKIVYQGPIVAPVEKGAELARLKLTRGSVLALDVPLKAAESVEKGSLPRRAFDAGYELVSGFIRRTLSRK